MRHWWSRAQSVWATLRGRAELDREMDEEFRLHQELRAADLERGGASREAAQRQARLEFGSAERYREEGRAARGLRLLDAFRGDVRYASRMFIRAPGFSIAAVLTLALGIGATAATVDVIEQLFFRPLPLHEPERLVELSTQLNERVSMSFVPEQFVSGLREETRQLDGMAGSKSLTVRIGGRSARAHFVTPDYFDVLGVWPAAGRGFAATEAAARVVVVSHGVWQARLGRASDVTGMQLLIDGQAFTIIGVLPQSFTLRRAGAEQADVWLPLAALPLLRPTYNSPTMNVIARLSPGVTLRQAEAELTAVLQRVQPEGGRLRFSGIRLTRLDPVAAHDRERVVGAVRLLGIAAGLLLLLAAVNVGGLLLARATARQHELGVRLAIGASRGRIIRQLTTEGAVLFLVGGVAAVLVSRLLVSVLTAVPWPVPVHLEGGWRPAVLLSGLAVAVIVGMAASLVPALHATLRARLLSGSPGALSGREGRLRPAAVVLQLALSLVLLVGAALFLRALQQAWSIDLGFQPQRVAFTQLEPAHGAGAAQLPPLAPVLEAARAVPGVESAALASAVPSYSDRTAITLSATTKALELPFQVEMHVVSPGYFSTMGIPVLAGRDFAATDGPGAERVVVISRGLAERLWPGESALGRSLGATSLRVVGIAGDVRTGSLRAPAGPAIYLPHTQEAAPSLTLVIRTGRDSRTLETLRQRIHAAAPGIAPVEFLRLSTTVDDVLLPQRMGATLLGAFALFGLLLAAVGLYGTLAYAVVLRTREVGVRMALGARRSDVLRQFLRRGLVLSVIGTGLGLGAAAATARVLAGLLHGVSPLDPAAYLAAALVLLLVALAASLIPARRAAGVDPMRTLRAE